MGAAFVRRVGTNLRPERFWSSGLAPEQGGRLSGPSVTPEARPAGAPGGYCSQNRCNRRGGQWAVRKAQTAAELDLHGIAPDNPVKWVRETCGECC